MGGVQCCCIQTQGTPTKYEDIPTHPAQVDPATPWVLDKDLGARGILGVQTNGLDKSVSSDYNVNRKALGQGAYGKVRSATCKPGGAQRAIKEVRKKMTEDQKGMSKELIEQEVAAMDALDNPYIIKIFEVYQDAVNVYLVMEYCAGGDVCDAVQSATSFTEKIASNMMKQVLSGVAYMHTRKVCHRDLKPDNFLLQHSNKSKRLEHNHLKIVDFGCAWHFQDGEYARKKVGSQFYIAPEVLCRHYQASCDLWSMGATMYILLAGYPAFRTENDISGKPVQFPQEDWGDVSDDAKELVKMLMERDVAKRLTAEQAVQHVWIEHNAPKSKGKNLNVQSNMVDFCKLSGMKKAALNIVARGLSDQQIEGLRETFCKLDKNKDGTISRQELEEGLKATNLGNQVKDVLEGLDMNGDGSIEYTEFLAGSLEKKQYTEEGACWSAFKTFDLDGSGTIARAELAKVLQHDDLKAVMGSGKTVDELFRACDTDNDGQITFKEFMAMMRRG